MKTLIYGVALALLAAAGCAAQGDAPPWQRQGLLDTVQMRVPADSTAAPPAQLDRPGA